MRKATRGAILLFIIVTTLLVSTTFAQQVDKEGKAWLATCSEPAALNVTGIWKDPKWGNVTLNQRQGSRSVFGSGDGWTILGVVSGKSVCLVFYNGSKVSYTAKLTAVEDRQLNGGYVKGMLSERSKTIPMNLVKSS